MNSLEDETIRILENLPIQIDLWIIDKIEVHMLNMKTTISKVQVHLSFLNQVHRKENKICKMHNSKIYLLYVVIQRHVFHQILILVNI